MATQDSYPSNITQTNDTNDVMDTVDDLGTHQNSGDNRTTRDSLEPTLSRRTTMIMRPLDQSGPPVDNPNNSPEKNAQLRKEYETVKKLNHMTETIIKDFQEASQNIWRFHDIMDETERLMDLWVQILTQTHHTKRLLEDPSLEKKETPHELPKQRQQRQQQQQQPSSSKPITSTATKPTTTTRTIPSGVQKRIRPPAPVGTYMTKKLKPPNGTRRTG